MENPACAHLVVLYFSMTEQGYTVRWWACQDCSTRFVPNRAVAILDRDLGTARSFLKQLRDRNNDGMDMDIWDRVELTGLLTVDPPIVEEFDPAKPIAAKSIG